MDAVPRIGRMKIALTWKQWTAVAAAAVAVAGGAWWWAAGRAPDVSFRTARLERGPLQATVSASGAVNPVTQVSVGTQVSGQVKELYVDFNTEVKAGRMRGRGVQFDGRRLKNRACRTVGKPR